MLAGYRSLVRCEGTAADYGFELQLEGTLAEDGIAPGSTRLGHLSFWAIDDLPAVTRGLRFEIREGARVVGHGEVIDVQSR